MLTLALETVTRRGSLATCVDGRARDATAGLAEARPDSDGAEAGRCEGRVGDTTRTHGERLPGEILEWLAARGHTPADVDLFAVVTGPGSFTGLRVGIAAIQGFALAGDRPVVSVPTLDAMIATWLPSLSSEGTVVVAWLDGQRGEVFASAVDAPGGASLEACTPASRTDGRPARRACRSSRPSLRRPSSRRRVRRPAAVDRRAASRASGRRHRGHAHFARRIRSAHRRLASRACPIAARDQAVVRPKARRCARQGTGRHGREGRRPASPLAGRDLRKISPPWTRCNVRRSRIPGVPKRSGGSSRTPTSHGCT